MIKKTTKRGHTAKSPPKPAQTEHRAGRKKLDAAKLVPILMVAAAVIFNLYDTTPVLAYGVNDSGDDLYHLSNSYYMEKLILQEHTIFGVVNDYGLGYPWFNTHQWLMYFTEAATNILSFDSISLLDAHKIWLVLFYSLYPVGIYYVLGKYGQKPMVRGLGALLSTTIISGWGHTTTSYFVIGLTSQSMAGFLFPFALGSFHQLITEGKGPRKTALLCVLTSFAHPYYGYFLVFMCLIDIGVEAYGRNRQQLVRIVTYAAAAGIIGALLALFWLVPLPAAMKYAPRTLDVQAVKGGFTLERAATTLIDGELLDVSKNFGDPVDKNLRWPTNNDKGRLPVLTALTLLGLAYALHRRDRFGFFCIFGFALAFIFIVGSDDMPILKYLPFAEYANAKRAIYVLEFFVICLSATSLNMVLSAAKDVASKLTGRHVGTAVAIVLLVLILYTPYRERMLTASKEVNVLSYWLPNFESMKGVIKRDNMDGRIYGDSETGISSAPLILSQPWLIDTPYMRRLYATRFWGDLYDFPNVMKLFNIRYIVAGGSKDVPESARKILTGVYSGPPYTLYRVEGGFGYADISHKKPALVTTTEEGWRVITEVWLFYYKNNTQADYMPDIVEYRNQGMNGDDYSQLMVYDAPSNQQLQTLFASRTSVYNSSDLRHNLIRAAIKDSKKSTSNDRITVISRTEDSFMATVETDKDGLFKYKVTYHPNWKATVDGIPQEVLRASPEFPAVFIKPGRHIVEFRYEEGLLQQALNIVSFLTLICVLLPNAVAARAAAVAKEKVTGLIDRP